MCCDFHECFCTMVKIQIQVGTDINYMLIMAQFSIGQFNQIKYIPKRDNN